MAARATTMDQLLHRSSAEIPQPTPAAAAVLPHNHVHLAAAPTPQQQGLQQDASAARPSLADPQRYAPSVSDSVPSPPEKRDVWCFLPLPANLPVPLLSRTCPNRSYTFVYSCARWAAMRGLVTTPAGAGMRRPHTHMQCLHAVSSGWALHDSDMNYSPQTGLAQLADCPWSSCFRPVQSSRQLHPAGRRSKLSQCQGIAGGVSCEALAARTH